MEKKLPSDFGKIVELMSIWAVQWERHVLQHGISLNEKQKQDAICVGVIKPENVRLLIVPNIPMPHYDLLYSTFIETKIFDVNSLGLSLGHGILLKFDAFPREYWLTHELVHVTQFEKFGGIFPAYEKYLAQCLTEGYAKSEMEREAHEKALECLSARNFNLDLIPKI